MFALRLQVAGAKLDIDRASHVDCACVGVSATLPDGSTLVMDFKDAAAVEAFGWAFLQAAESLKATREAQHAASEAHSHA